MTTPAPKRREQRRTHLDASAVPVERALNARADELIQHAGRLRADPVPQEKPSDQVLADHPDLRQLRRRGRQAAGPFAERSSLQKLPAPEEERGSGEAPLEPLPRDRPEFLHLG